LWKQRRPRAGAVGRHRAETPSSPTTARNCPQIGVLTNLRTLDLDHDLLEGLLDRSASWRASLPLFHDNKLTLFESLFTR
jgi:hypothetical protein